MAVTVTVTVTVIGAEERLLYNRTTVDEGLLSGAVDDAASRCSPVFTHAQVVGDPHELQQ